MRLALRDMREALAEGSSSFAAGLALGAEPFAPHPAAADNREGTAAYCAALGPAPSALRLPAAPALRCAGAAMRR